ncbi:hypothetical protein AVEN_194969-1 [Araneus ventricosus]|uniref:Uncharacterized protein n=1 Tax=Araneus ventricosus TaxID=182803 RepID=A0A4Y2QPC1_ARAVE|nr:hypothetical protein AVEN_194969-1 [Araneus ventricosus]
MKQSPGFNHCTDFDNFYFIWKIMTSRYVINGRLPPTTLRFRDISQNKTLAESLSLYNSPSSKYSHRHYPSARRKTLSRVASNRRVEERRDTDIKSTATFGNLSAVSLGEEFVFDRSTKRNETSVGSIYAK